MGRRGSECGIRGRVGSSGLGTRARLSDPRGGGLPFAGKKSASEVEWVGVARFSHCRICRWGHEDFLKKIPKIGCWSTFQDEFPTRGAQMAYTFDSLKGGGRMVKKYVLASTLLRPTAFPLILVTSLVFRRTLPAILRQQPLRGQLVSFLQVRLQPPGPRTFWQ